MIFHGTTKSNLDRILSSGFDDRMIMFADRVGEAARYAESYARSKNDKPVLISLDESTLKISYDGLSYESARKLYEQGYIDGYLSDTFKRNGLADYYVIFNTKKLTDILTLPK